MKKLFLLLIVIMGFVRIGFGQDVPMAMTPMTLSPKVIETCECGDKGINISTGFNNSNNTAFQVGQVENQWKIVSGPGGVQNPTGYSSPLWDANNNNSTWIIPKNQDSGDYVYEYTFTVPTGSTGIIKFRRIGADDRLIATLDSNPLPFFTAGTVSGWFKNTTLKQCLILNNNLSAGSHTLQFSVKNINSITGLLVEGCLQLIPACKIPDEKCNPDFNVTLKPNDTGLVNIDANPSITSGANHYWGVVYASSTADITPIPLNTIKGGSTWGSSNISGICNPIGMGTGITCSSSTFGYNYSGFPIGKCFKITHYIKCCDKWYSKTKTFCTKAFCTEQKESEVIEVSNIKD